AAVRAGELDESVVDDKVSRILRVAGAVGALGGDGRAPGLQPQLIDPALLRDVAARSFVLLKNDGGLLPLAGRTDRVALIGPNAIDPQLQGGGSIRVL